MTAADLTVVFKSLARGWVKSEVTLALSSQLMDMTSDSMARNLGEGGAGRAGGTASGGGSSLWNAQNLANVGDSLHKVASLAPQNRNLKQRVPSPVTKDA